MKTAFKFLGLGVVLLAVVVGLVATFRVGAAPAIDIEPSLPAIGARTPLVVSVHAPGRGLGDVRIELVQGEETHLVAERHHRPRPPWSFGGTGSESDEIRTEVGRQTIEGLREGEARIRVTVSRAGTWLLHPAPVVAERVLPVRLVPPALSVLSSQHYVAQGGSGVVVYRVGSTAVRDGVQVGAWFFPGAPLPGFGTDDHFALFGIPWDESDDTRIRLVAEDDVGNRSEATFVDRFFPRPPSRDRITLDDAFMSRVVPEILRQTPELTDKGDLLENYLEVNRDLRKENAEALVQLGKKPTLRFLWSEPFLPFPNAKVMSSFADQRTYLYGGREVDHQVHLGFDLASIARSPVPAANRGIVRMARYFGIYGNAVVLDHGYGLMTLYAHMSELDVSEGDEVERGQVLGRTGATGLAGGDHLHFTTLVDGLPVNPMEWWDAAWIRERVTRKLGEALPFAEAGS
jgi:murein DD-endopeptidase MepM/ murein hydrolase activator NlpD